MNILKQVAIWLLIIGGLNWLLVAFGFNLVEWIFQPGSTLTMIVYVLVGLAAIFKIVVMFMKDGSSSM